VKQGPDQGPSAFTRGRSDDRFEIADLLHRYAYHFDRNEPELVATLFSEDAVVDYGPEVPPITGRANIAGRIAPGLATIFVATSHHISNVLISFDHEDSAAAVAYVYAWHRYVDGSPDGHLWGQYHVRAIRTSPGWRLSALTLRTFAVTNFHRDRMHPVARRSTETNPRRSRPRS